LLNIFTEREKEREYIFPEELGTLKLKNLELLI